MATCTSADLVPLGTPANLLTYLQTDNWNCLQYLWTYDVNVRGSYNNANMSAVLGQIQSLAPSYMATDAGNIRELLFYVHVGYYQQYGHSQDPGLFTPAAIKAAATAAFQAFAASPHYNDMAGGNIVLEWIEAVDAASLWDGQYAKLVQIVSDYWTDQSRQADYQQQYNVYSVFLAFERAIYEAGFQGIVDANLVTLLQNYAVDVNPPPNAGYLVNHAIYLLGLIGLHAPGLKPQVITALNAAFAAQPQLSQPWLWAVDALCNLGSCPQQNGQTITHAVAAAELEAKLFPNLYSFDDGAIAVHTSLTIDKFQGLYHAIKQVAAQFNRVTKTIAPLQDDPNGILIVKIYASHDDYVNYHPFLTGLPTNNGGLYYEQSGTFYTYDRPPAPGDYTLEELTRHEYSHYLIERFLTAGLWGTAPIYTTPPTNRMVWFDEGFAEFLTGSSDVGGVLARKHLASLVAADGPAAYMHLADVFSASYGDFKFYRYAAFAFHFMYTKHPELLRQFIDFVRAAGVNNDAATQAAITGFDMLCTMVAQNFDAEYQAYLAQIVANAANLTDPSTAVPPLNALSSNDPNQIQTQTRTTRLGYLANASVSTKAADTRFTCRGYLTGQPVNVQDVDAAWTLFNGNLEELLGALRKLPLNNFQYTVARFGAIRFEATGANVYPIADYYVEGPLGTENSVPPQPAARVQGDFKSTRLGGGAVCQLANGVVTCTLTLSTQAFSVGTPDAVLQQQLADDLVELRDQVYAINPPYYRDFDCVLTGMPKTIATPQNQKYLLCPVTATIKVPA
jgi:microbial collagenase